MRAKTESKNPHSIIHLLIGWGIILFSYIVIRAVFAMFGFTSASMLGIVLSIIPYLLAAIYFFTVVYAHGMGYYVLALLLPSVVEKIALYLLGAFLYDISPMNLKGVFEVIASQKPYVNLFPQLSARHIFEISFMGWKYILSNLLFSFFLIFLLYFVSKKQEMLALLNKNAED